jgi:predicted nuclease of predicted toxin-antitoxin system
VRRTLLDEQLPRDLKTALAEVSAVSVHDLGWKGTKNGELLRRAADAGFEVFVTMDRKLRHQQNLRGIPFGIVLVRARTNRLGDLLPLVPALLAAIAQVRAGEIREVG